jgi:radical SAM protein with 4Fe4S-binding SPASM domain
MNGIRPEEIKIEVTPSCNLSCYFCFNKNTYAKTKRQTRQLSTEKWMRVIDEIAEVGIPNLRFTGGEPLTRNDIFDLMLYAKLKGLHVKLNTNGVLVDEKVARILERCADEVLLPLHAHDAKTEKKITGSNIFNKKINAIKSLVNSKVAARCNTVITKNVISNLDKFVKLVVKLEVNDWFLALPVPTENTKNLINNNDIRELIEKILWYHSKNIQIRIAQGMPFCSYDPRKVSQVAIGASSCGPYSMLAIDPMGKIKPCYSIDKKLGKATKDSIMKCWEHEFCKNIRNFNPKVFPKICIQCRYLQACKGGCRFAAKLINGSFSAMDPLARPAIYKNLLF